MQHKWLLDIVQLKLSLFLSFCVFWSCTSCLDRLTLRFCCTVHLLLCFLFASLLISINIVRFTRADYESPNITSQKSDQGFFIWYLLILAPGNPKEKQKKITSNLMYQKQDMKVRKILTNFRKVNDFKKDYFLPLVAFAAAIL